MGVASPGSRSHGSNHPVAGEIMLRRFRWYCSGRGRIEEEKVKVKVEVESEPVRAFFLNSHLL